MSKCAGSDDGFSCSTLCCKCSNNAAITSHLQLIRMYLSYYKTLKMTADFVSRIEAILSFLYTSYESFAWYGCIKLC